MLINTIGSNIIGFDLYETNIFKIPWSENGNEWKEIFTKLLQL